MHTLLDQVSHALACQQVNVEELNTEGLSAPMSGETLFKAQARLRLPAGCDLAALQAELQRIAEDLMVDIALSPLEAPARG